MAGKKAVWAGRGVSVLACGMFVMSAAFKFMGGPQVSEGFAHLGLPDSMRIPLGILEISCVIIYLIPQTAVLGAVLLAGYMGGVICTHWRVGDPVIIPIALGLALWAGLYLREDRLRPLLPLRTGIRRRS
jgi:hypothetical protein